MNDLLRAIQLPEEPLRKLLQEHPLFPAYKKLIPKEVLQNPYEGKLSMTLMNGLELTRQSHPALVKLAGELAQAFGLSERIRLFRENGSEDVMSSFSDGANAVLAFNERILSQLGEEHLRYPLGHELGHVCFGHLQNVVEIHLVGMMGEPPWSEGVERFRERNGYVDFCDIACVLNQLQELNADRAGLVAAGNLKTTLEAVILAQFDKPDPYGCPEPDALLRQGEELIARSDYLNVQFYLDEESHPCTAVSARALEYFYYSEVCDPLRNELARYPGDYVRDHLEEFLPLKAANIRLPKAHKAGRR